MSAVLRHVRVRSSSADRATVRMAVARQLESADFDVPSVPPSSILVIRRLRDPLPGRLTANGQAVTADLRWQSAVRAHMAEAARSAVRPVGGRIAADAGAILFSDEGELFACLAMQLAIGGPTAWWREAITDYARDRSLLGLLQRRPDLVPAVVARLVRWNVAEDVVGRLSSSEALSVVSALIVARQLSGLFDLIERFPTGEGNAEDGDRPPGRPRTGGPDTSAQASPSRRRPNGSSPDEEVPAIPPWRHWWTPSNRGLATHQQLLIGLSVALQRSPEGARSTPFTVRVREWFEWHHRRQRDVEAARTMERDAASGATEVKLGAEGAESETARPPATPGEHRPGPVETLAKTDGPTAPGKRSATAPPPAAVQAEGKTSGEDTSTSPESWEREGTLTELGGVFFLINVMEHLELPDSFEAGCGLASGVGAIGTLEALARALSHPAAEDVLGDPVWSVLAQVDGRAPGEPPRGNGLTSEGLSLPHAWLHGNGFVPTADRTTLLSTLRDEGWPLALIRWMEFVLPFLRWRIATALGSLDGEAADLLTDLLLLPARVYVTDVHIDVVTSIESVRLPVRLAGLDRSPGWMKSMQRVVLFHFE